MWWGRIYNFAQLVEDLLRDVKKLILIFKFSLLELLDPVLKIDPSLLDPGSTLLGIYEIAVLKGDRSLGYLCPK